MTSSDDFTLLPHQITEILDMLPRDGVADNECGSIVEPRKVGRGGLGSELVEESGRGAFRFRRPLISIRILRVCDEGPNGRVGFTGLSCRFEWIAG